MNPVHREHYARIKEAAEEKISSLFYGIRTSPADITGHETIKDEQDLHDIVEYIETHGDCHDRATAMMAMSAWVQANNELTDAGAM